MRPGWCPILVSLLCAACSTDGSGPPGFVGDACAVHADCRSRMCENIGSRLGCTRSCDAATPCPLGGVGGPFVCGGEGFCVEACEGGEIQGEGASRMICLDGMFVPCSTADPAAQCALCGCEPFGGGNCVDGTGCVTPRPDGEPCTVGAECVSGGCHRETLTCGPLREIGEPCSVDADCASENCSTDGDETRIGRCNVPLGSDCESGTDTCNFCLTSLGGGFCMRRRCDPEDAPNCASTTEHPFECVANDEGGYSCFERCPMGDDGIGWRCLISGEFCRMGYCF
jgi:hypothetical protein